MLVEQPFDGFAVASGIRDTNSARASLFEGCSLRTARRSTDDTMRKDITMNEKDNTLNSFLRTS